MKKLFRKPFDSKGFKITTCVCFIILIVAIGLGILSQVVCEYPMNKDYTQISFTDFTNEVDNGKIEKLYYGNTNSQYLFIVTTDGKYQKTTSPSSADYKLELMEKGINVLDGSEFKLGDTVKSNRLMWAIFVIILDLMVWSFSMTAVKMTASAEKEKNKHNGNITIVKKKKKIPVDENGNPIESDSEDEDDEDDDSVSSAKTFDDVAGLDEVKRDMQCLVDFLVNRDKYEAAGAKLPKGVILYGPPGTGKTLIAKAVAGEADVPFLYMSGSEFIEMYAGVGAKRVRELFEEARKEAPCIVFIDEIDAIGGKRSNRDSTGEDRKTINALLTEMDGFKESDNIIVIAATNRIDDIDSALLRPGRFTDKFCVPLPDSTNDRLKIIEIYAANKKFHRDVDMKELAKETIGFSPAQIEALLNEAAILSVQHGRTKISKKEIDDAMFKMLLSGHVKDDQSNRDERELEIVAWHEAGHALVGRSFGKEITKITILSSTSGAGGVTFSTPTQNHLQSLDDIEHQIMELYGGRAAEYLLFGEDRSKVTTGASNDIERASQLIYDAIVKYGLNQDVGPLNLESAGFDNAEIIRREIDMAKWMEGKTIGFLKEHYDELKCLAEALKEKETIYMDELDEILNIHSSEEN